MSGFRLGRIFGISVHIDWSWLLIFGLISWNLASAFQQVHPEWSTSMQWGLALAAAFLFFLSVLAHELAHSVVAKARGIPVRNITLFLFGGVANIQKEPDSPMSELVITVVGPLTSFVLGALFLIVGTLNASLGDLSVVTPLGMLSGLGPVSTILIWIGSVNILVGAFNLIPGFPLDGGRILRSILWAITRDLVKATRWAAWVGQAVALTLILAGMAMLFGVRIPLLGSGFINGVWIIFIGWFLQNAASRSYQRIVIQDILEDVPVRRIMSTDVPAVPANTTVEDLIDNHIMQSDHRTFVVFEHEQMTGLVTVDDVRRVPREARPSLPVREIMTPSREFVTVAPEDDVSRAMDKLKNQDSAQLPVVQGDRVVGLLRRKDILRWLELNSQSGN